MNNFTIIGIDDKDHPELPEQARAAIATHHVFSGGKGTTRSCVTTCRRPPLDRHHRPAGRGVPPIREPPGHRCFRLRGPTLFGFANTVLKRLPDAKITLIPTFNSLQTLAHRILLPYHDMHVVSLTGRPWHEFDRALIEGQEKIGVLTDREHTPTTIAERMLRYGYDNYIMYVGEALGSDTETVRVLIPDDATALTFRHPNCLILYRTYERQRHFGIPESDFELLDGRVNMITKAPIRLLTLAQLDLRRHQTLWDIGFCTGSVSIEAKLQFPHLHVVAFEQRPEGKRLMELNAPVSGRPASSPASETSCRLN